ncbi:MAG: secondary thiamine-phosphate synthase enzyme YjbQ [Thermoplasmata archaeon]
MIFSRKIEISTHGELDFIDLTPQVKLAVSDSEFKSGVINIFSVGSTCSIIIMENEEGLVQDFKNIINEIVPAKHAYKHNEIDNNAYSHIRSSILKPEVTIPFSDGNLLLGTWQQIFLVELDVSTRKRIVSLTVVGE